MFMFRFYSIKLTEKISPPKEKHNSWAENEIPIQIKQGDCRTYEASYNAGGAILKWKFNTFVAEY